MVGFLSDLGLLVSEYEPLGPHTCFGLGGSARWMTVPPTVEQLGAIVHRCQGENAPLKVLGLGANVLVSDDGVDGVVVRLQSPAFDRVVWSLPRAGSLEAVEVTVGAGADMSRLSVDVARRGWSGLECMAGIPGTLGGAIRMNAGGRFGNISQVVRDVTVMDSDGLLRTLSRNEVGFGYRRTDLGDAIVCQATLMLRPDHPDKVRDRLIAIWDDKKRSQPMAKSNAGCVFKNPPGATAGQLIDRAGLKGRTVGGASVSRRHANFIVAQEGATATDVLKLIGVIRREVANQFDVELELEIEVWSRKPAQRLEPVS